MDFFFVADGRTGEVRLGAQAEARLERRYRDCLAAVESTGEPLAEGVWLRRAGGPGCGLPPSGTG